MAFLRKFGFVSVMGVLAGAMPAAAATTVVLDFSGDICGGVCGNGSSIDGDYGSGSGVDLSWATVAGPGDAAVLADSVSWWGPSYGDLNAVAYSSGGGTVGQVTFSVGDGFELTLDRLDGAGWPNIDRTVGVRVYDLGYNLLLDTTEVFPGTGFTTVNLGVSSTSALILQWGPDSFNGGIDNLTFTVRGNLGPPVIPEPGTWAMLIAGFGLVGGAMRRRRQAFAG